MQLINLNCPNCKADIEPIEGKQILFCPFCGTKLLLEEDNEVKIEEIKVSDKIAKEETRREKILRDYEIKLKDLETQQTLSHNEAMILTVSIISISIMLCVLCFFMSH